MSLRELAIDEGVAELRADSTLRALAERDALEPSRAIDRAVLASARATAQAACATGTRRRLGPGPALRWGIPAALAAGAVFAAVTHRTAVHSGAPRSPGQPLVELTQLAPITTLSMVRVSVRHRGERSRERPAVAPAYNPYVRAETSNAGPPLPTSSLIETSATFQSIRIPPPPQLGSKEWTYRGVVDASARAFPPRPRASPATR